MRASFIQQVTGFSNLPPLVIYTMSVPDRPVVEDDFDETDASATDEAVGAERDPSTE
jgi:hypothetical protein